MSVTTPDFRSKIPTVAELEEAIVTYFPRQQKYLSGFFKKTDLSNGSVVYEVQSQIEILSIEVFKDGTTVAEITSRQTATTSPSVSREDYVAALQELRHQWNVKHDNYAPLG